MKFSVLLNEKEGLLLFNYMKENNIKSKAEAIKKDYELFKNNENLIKNIND